MFIQDTCPRCGDQLSSDSQFGNTLYCQCGWHDRSAEGKLLARGEKVVAVRMFVTMLIVLAIGAALTYLSTMKGKISYLKITTSLGVANYVDFMQLGNLCERMKDLDCARKAYEQAFQLNNSNKEILVKVARFYKALGDLQGAIGSYTQYLQSADGHKIISEYGKMLEQSGRVDQAIDLYKQNLIVNTEYINVVAVEELIRLLMNRGRLQEAQKTIAFFKEKTKRTDFDQQLSTLQAQLKGKGRKI